MKNECNYFTSEAVSNGHPDKVADQISDAILDAYLEKDEEAKVACEVLVTTNQVIVAGEVKSKAYVDVPKIVRSTIATIGYTNAEYNFSDKMCEIKNLMHRQSPDITQAVEATAVKELRAGDQGMMFGYATNETADFMPLPYHLANLILRVLKDAQGKGILKCLRPDAKSQVTVEYNDKGIAQHIDSIVISIQHDDFIRATDHRTQSEADVAMQGYIRQFVELYLLPAAKQRIKNAGILSLFDEETKLYVNPSGRFVTGGPDGDTGLTGRKIIVDTYGGKGAHGGGAFSGKDPSKVDRSAAYMARFIAKNMVAAGVADEMQVQLSYAIGVTEPVGVSVYTYGTNHTICSDAGLADYIRQKFPLKPKAIIDFLNLRKVRYLPTAAYGHFGREPQRIGEYYLFPWERIDQSLHIDDELGC